MEWVIAGVVVVVLGIAGVVIYKKGQKDGKEEGDKAAADKQAQLVAERAAFLKEKATLTATLNATIVALKETNAALQARIDILMAEATKNTTTISQLKAQLVENSNLIAEKESALRAALASLASKAATPTHGADTSVATTASASSGPPARHSRRPEPTFFRDSREPTAPIPAPTNAPALAKVT